MGPDAPAPLAFSPLHPPFRQRLVLGIGVLSFLACLIWAVRVILALLSFMHDAPAGGGLALPAAFLWLLPALSLALLIGILFDRRQASGLGSLIMLAGLVNFTTWLEAGWRIGGYAYLGKIEAGRYFLGNHGALTPVDPALYQYSMTHGASAATMIFMVLALMAVQLFDGGLRRTRPWRDGGARP